MAVVKAGDVAVLADDEGRRAFLVAGSGPVRVPALGVVESDRVVGLAWGSRFDYGGRSYLVLPAAPEDLAAGIERRAQIVTAKDIAAILYLADVRPGVTVVEGGAGSGSLTLALARSVVPGGRLVSYELRADHLAVARGNVIRAGLADAVEFRETDVRQPWGLSGVHAVVLDMPDPWEAVPAASDALTAGGHFVSYSPLVSQVEATHKALGKHGFTKPRTFETLQREWVVGESGSRPSFEMLGHTGYLTHARKTAR
ncbi:MAG: tRNA (adenine-N1)-methyltransferase [Methanobacteriota archaeon]